MTAGMCCGHKGNTASTCLQSTILQPQLQPVGLANIIGCWQYEEAVLQCTRSSQRAVNSSTRSVGTRDCSNAGLPISEQMVQHWLVRMQTCASSRVIRYEQYAPTVCSS